MTFNLICWWSAAYSVSDVLPSLLVCYFSGWNFSSRRKVQNVLFFMTTLTLLLSVVLLCVWRMGNSPFPSFLVAQKQFKKTSNFFKVYLWVSNVEKQNSCAFVLEKYFPSFSCWYGCLGLKFVCFSQCFLLIRWSNKCRILTTKLLEASECNGCNFHRATQWQQCERNNTTYVRLMTLATVAQRRTSPIHPMS